MGREGRSGQQGQLQVPAVGACVLSNRAIATAADALVSLELPQLRFKHIANRLISIITRSNHHISFNVVKNPKVNRFPSWVIALTSAIRHVTRD